MQLTKCSYKLRCELGGCRNLAEYTLRTKRVGIGSTMCLCKECLVELYEEIGKEIVPVSPKSTYKKSKDKKERGVLSEKELGELGLV